MLPSSHVSQNKPIYKKGVCQKPSKYMTTDLSNQSHLKRLKQNATKPRLIFPTYSNYTCI